MKTKIEIAAYARAYRIIKKDEIAVSQRIYRQTNRAEIAARKKDFRLKNKETIAAKQRTYQQNNRPLINVRVSAKYKTDAAYRLSCILRARMKCALKKNLKTGRTVAELGCTSVELRAYIESLFETGMSWSNYGVGKNQWSIDHIIPLAAVDLTNREAFLKISHFKNLQPMWHVLNVAKGNKI